MMATSSLMRNENIVTNRKTITKEKSKRQIRRKIKSERNSDFFFFKHNKRNEKDSTTAQVLWQQKNYRKITPQNLLAIVHKSLYEYNIFIFTICEDRTLYEF